MTLRKHLVLAMASLTLLSAVSAEAYVTPGNRGPGPVRPQPLPPEPPRAPQPPLPPGRGDDGYNRPGNGRTEQKYIVVNRRFINETVSLTQMLGLDSRYNGYVVESVMVDVRGSTQNSSLDLIVNGYMEQQTPFPRGRVMLYPRGEFAIGRGSLQLGMRNVVDVDAIYVNLRPGRGGGGGYQELPITVSVTRRLLGNDRLDIGAYIDLNRYRGYRIQSIEVYANSVYGGSFMDLVINGFNQGRSLEFGRYAQTQTVMPTNAVIGQGAESIVFYSRGDMDVHTVTLRLSTR